MPRGNKDIAGKIVDFLREKGGRAVIIQLQLANTLKCGSHSVFYSLHKLLRKGIVLAEGDSFKGKRGGTRIVLADAYKEGDNWREALKRKSSGDKPEVGLGVTVEPSGQPTPAKAHTDDGCLQYRITLSRDLVEVYKRLEEAQGQIVRLQDEIKAKDRKIEDLIGELEAKAGARKKDVRELASLESNLRELKIKTSSAVPAASSVRRLMIDRSGVVTLPSEGLPDTR